MSRLTAVALACGLVACSQPTDVWTLYRSSALGPNMRIHVATFDSTGTSAFPGPSYNQAQCNEIADIMRANDPAEKTWWCEPGRYHP